MSNLSRSSSTRKSITNFDYGLKCIVLGDSGVGKTCLLQKLTNLKHAMKSSPTVEGVFHSRTLKVSDRKIQLSIWDTAGQEAFRSVTRIYYRGASCALLVYDVTRRPTFENIESWMTDLKNNTTNPKPVLVLVGNKSDLTDERAVSTEEGENYARIYGMSFIETSAQKNDNVDLVFDKLSQDVYQNIKTGNVVPNAEVNGIKLGQSPPGDQTKDSQATQKKSCSC